MEPPDMLEDEANESEIRAAVLSILWRDGKWPEKPAPPPEPMWTPEKMQRAIEKSKADCAKGKHWLGLNADLTPSARCAWDFCDYGKTEATIEGV